MTKMKHTDGTWVEEKTSPTTFTISSKTNRGKQKFTQPIANTFHSNEAEANAQLIASAPELLQMLKEIKRNFDHIDLPTDLKTDVIDIIKKLS